jgi:hypothetical protein
MLFLTQLFGGTGGDRHHSARSTCPAAGFTRVSPPAARWLSGRMATFFERS